MTTVFTGMLTSSSFPSAGSVGAGEVTLHAPWCPLSPRWGWQRQHSTVPSPCRGRGALYTSMPLVCHLHASLSLTQRSPHCSVTPSRPNSHSRKGFAWLLLLAETEVEPPRLNQICLKGNLMITFRIHWSRPQNQTHYVTVVILQPGLWKPWEIQICHPGIPATKYYGIIFWRRLKQRVRKNKRKKQIYTKVHSYCPQRVITTQKFTGTGKNSFHLTSNLFVSAVTKPPLVVLHWVESPGYCSRLGGNTRSELKRQKAVTNVEHTLPGPAGAAFISRPLRGSRRECQSSNRKEKKYFISSGNSVNLFCLAGLGFGFVCFGVCLLLESYLFKKIK